MFLFGCFFMSFTITSYHIANFISFQNFVCLWNSLSICETTCSPCLTQAQLYQRWCMRCVIIAMGRQSCAPDQQKSVDWSPPLDPQQTIVQSGRWRWLFFVTTARCGFSLVSACVRHSFGYSRRSGFPVRPDLIVSGTFATSRILEPNPRKSEQ